MRVKLFLIALEDVITNFINGRPVFWRRFSMFHPSHLWTRRERSAERFSNPTFDFLSFHQISLLNQSPDIWFNIPIRESYFSIKIYMRNFISREKKMFAIFIFNFLILCQGKETFRAFNRKYL